MKTPFQQRPGTDLRDPAAHQRDHQRHSRRSFLRNIGLAGAGAVSLGSLPLTALRGFPLASMLGANGQQDRKLVLIRLKGGNDGLNTVVPLYAYNAYTGARPTLAHAPADLFDLNADYALPTSMQPLAALWDSDRMRVVNSVGYENHNLSHFTGADIMASGSSNVNENGDGWLARYYVSENPDYRTDPSDAPPAIKIGGPTSILFNDADKVDISANFATPQGLEELAQSGRRFDDLTAPDDCYHGDQVLFLRSVANAAYRYSSSIFDAYAAGSNGVDYTSSLGDQLRLVARLIKGGLPTQLYLVTLDGFDTHVGQSGAHADLLDDLSLAVRQFYDDLALDGSDQDVLTMTYSEFGRRVQQNATGGTDHGAALPVLLFGPALGGSGTHGTPPDLLDLDSTGNLKPGTDFRALYATVLENWFCLPPDEVDAVLGTPYERLPELGLECGTVNTTRPGPVADTLPTSLVPLGGGRYRLRFELPRPAAVQADLLGIDGRHLQRLAVGRYAAGEQFVDFALDGRAPELATYVYRLRVSGVGTVARQFVGSSH